MKQQTKKRSLITAGIILGVLLVAIATVAIVRSLGSKSNDPYAQEVTNDSSDTSTSEPEKEKMVPENTKPTNSEETTVDPETVNYVDIAPLSISVAYLKGVGAFEYQVLRSANGTRYVEFRNEALIGTKCTNDMGTFASIVVSPTDAERAAVNKVITVGGTDYGLSIADTTCTGDGELLAEYQKAFSEGFSLLKKID